MSFNSSTGILKPAEPADPPDLMNSCDLKRHGEEMSELKDKHCKPCEGGVCPLDGQQSAKHLEDLPGWQLGGDGKSIKREFTFKNFRATISFINNMAEVAETEGHHPDFSAGYDYCTVAYTTHAIDGLSENDFICAAKINDIVET